ncbi:hypothetical protein V8E54_007577 [Elaphomyces granulatus]
MTIVNAAGRAMTDVTDDSQLCDVTDDQKPPGRGIKKRAIFDKKYHCIADPGKCSWGRRASKLHESTSAIRNHIEVGGPKGTEPTMVDKFDKMASPTFEEALIDGIIAKLQAFTVTESEWFTRTMKAGGAISTDFKD